MEAKLKALKVVDLKDICAKANLALPARANKADLIAKILASPDAVAVYNENHGGTPAQAAPAAPSAAATSLPKATPPQPPKTVAAPSSSSAPKSAPSSPPKPASQVSPKAPDASKTSTKPAEDAAAPAADKVDGVVDDEAEKRKARAARFGIALVEPKVAPAKKGGKGAANGKASKPALSEDEAKIAARAARFGEQAPTTQVAKETGNKKRSAEPVNEDEIERRKKRAARFGIPLV